MTTIRELPPVGCTGNCNQDRACDCRANVDDDGPPRERMKRLDGWLLLAYFAACSAIIVVGVWWLA